MPQSTSNVRTEDDQLIVEAPTAEAALAVVADRLGTRARIAGVERVRRGGVGGFFARELVQVTATGDEEAPGTAPLDEAGASEPDNAVDRLLRQISERDDPFATTLQQKMAARHADGGGDAGPRPRRPAEPGRAPDAAEDGARPERAAGPSMADVARPAAPSQGPNGRSATSPAPAPSSSGEPVAALPAPQQPAHAQGPVFPGGATVAGAGGPTAAPLPGTPQWSIRNLCRLGLPPLLAPDEAARMAPHDDLAWTHAIAASLRPLCGPLPDGPTIIVGPAAESLAAALDLPVHWPGQPTPPESFIAPISDRPTERDWLASVRGRRHLHLVAGGPGWRGLLFDDPAVLSHTDASMCQAVTLAFQLGIRFGYTCHASGAFTRTNPIDLAVSIRRLLPTY